MDKNKSIDGLTVRRPQKTAPLVTTSQKSPNPNKAPKTSKANSKTTPKSATKTTARSQKPKTSTPTPTRPSKPTTKSSSRTTKSPKSKQAKPTRTTKNRTAPIDGIQPTTHSHPSFDQDQSSIPNQIQPEVIPPVQATSEPLASADDFLSPVQSFSFDEQTGKLEAIDPSMISQNQQFDNDDDNDNNSETSIQPTKPKKEKKKMSKKRKIILSVILSIILILIAGFVWLILWGNDIIARITGGQGNVFDLLTFIDDHYEPLKTDKNGRTNILAFGTSGYNMEGDEGNGTHDGAQLTDSIMVISLNQETGDIAMLSLPRDLKVSSTCTATSKINELYWCNNMDGDNEQAGADALVDEVSDILDIDFQYYAHLNWGSLVQIVDTLGGIKVTLDEGIYDYYYTKAVFEPGVEYTINGADALGLARARHGTESGDFSRGASQQKILIGIKDKLHEKNLSITELTDLAGTLGDNLRTNFNVEELKTFAHLISTLDLNTMRQVSLIDPEPLMTTGAINNISYVLPTGGANYYTKIQNYVAKMFSNDPRDREDSSILILNGTDTPGLASSEKESLATDGYDNIYVDDAPAGEYTDQYTLYYLTDTAPETNKLLEAKYHTTAKSLNELPAGISTLYDFVLILGEQPSTETE